MHHIASMSGSTHCFDSERVRRDVPKPQADGQYTADSRVSLLFLVALPVHFSENITKS